MKTLIHVFIIVPQINSQTKSLLLHPTVINYALAKWIHGSVNSRLSNFRVKTTLLLFLASKVLHVSIKPLYWKTQPL